MEAYEEKYKDLVKRLNKAREEKGVYTFNSVLDAVAPELKIEDSEDERIRKEIIESMRHQMDRFSDAPNVLNKYEKWIAWLKKQGEHANFRNKIQIGDKVTRNRDGMLVNLSQLKRVAKRDEKQGEQKHYGQRQECVDCQFNYAGECKGSCAMKRGEQKPVEPMIVGQEPLYDYTNANICQKDFAEQKPAWSDKDDIERSVESFKLAMKL